jgi:hypothetical protein
MKITQEVRDYAASQKLSEEEALQKGRVKGDGGIKY